MKMKYYMEYLKVHHPKRGYFFSSKCLLGRPQMMTAPCISSTVAMETMPGIGMRIITKISIEFVKPDRRKKLLEDYELPLYFR